MKKINRILPFLVVFSFFLTVGVLAGHGLGARINPRWDGLPREPAEAQRESSLALPATPEAEEIKTVETGLDAVLVQPKTTAAAIQPIPSQAAVASSQENILLLVIDDMAESVPALKGAWLVIHIPDTQRIILLPVYPEQPGVVQAEDKPPLAAYFSLNARREPDENFLSELQARGLWWTRYILLDSTAVERLAGILVPRGENQSGVDLFASTSVDAFWAQADLLHSLCQRSTFPPDSIRQLTQEIFSLLPNHVRTDLDLEGMLAQLPAATARGGFACEFPTLTMAAAMR